MDSKELMDYINDHCSKDETRINLHKPSKVESTFGEFYCGTDGTVLLFLSTDDYKLPINVVDDYPNINKALSYVEMSDIDTITRDDLKEIIDSIPLVDEMDCEDLECPDCYEGESECDHCGSSYDCTTCDGSSFIEKGKPTGKKIKSDTHIFVLSGSNFYCQRAIVLLEFMDVTGVSELTISYASKYKLFMFKSGNSFLGLMPTRDLSDVFNGEHRICFNLGLNKLTEHLKNN